MTARTFIAAAWKLPGVPVLLPLAVGVAVTPVVHRATIGLFTLALGPSSAMASVALLLVCVGAQISPRAIGPVGGRVAVILAGATLIPAAAVASYWWRFGPAGVGGVSVPAAAVAAVCTSTAIWLALAGRYGSPDDQWGGTVAAAINSGPLLPLLLLAAGRPGATPWAALADAVVPLALGFAVGLAGGDSARRACRACLPVLMVAFSFQLGARLDPAALVTQAPAGAALGVAVVVLSGAATAVGYRLLLHRPAAVGWASGAVTIGAPVVPAVIGAALPVWGRYVAAATAQVGVAVLVSSVAATLLCAAAARLARHRAVAHHGAAQSTSTAATAAEPALFDVPPASRLAGRR